MQLAVQQNYAMVPADGDGEGEDEDVGGGKPQEEAKLKKRYKDMVEEKKQNEDYTNRLQKKLQRLNESLAELSEQADSQRRTLELERNKEKDEQTSLRRERDTKARNQETRIREGLSDVLYQKPSNKGRHFELDTVRVTFVPLGKSVLYPLAFRIDDNTTIKALRDNACKYWNLPQNKYILKTMANNKCSDEIRVKECFKQGELAQLRLEPQSQSTAEPKEEELKAIMPKDPANRSKRGVRDLRLRADGVDKMGVYTDGYMSKLKLMGGIYFLLKLRDVKPSEHVQKIKLRDIVVYCTLAIIIYVVYIGRRPAGQDFWHREGIVDALLPPTRKPDVLATDYSTSVPGFLDLKTQEDVWDWLNHTVVNAFWPLQYRDSLASYNLLVGYMALRTQRVVDNFECEEENKAVADKHGGSCNPHEARGDHEATSDIEAVKNYWNDVFADNVQDDPDRFRASVNPGVFVSAEENEKKRKISSLGGAISDYDASGYSVNYRMEISNKTEALEKYRQDLQFFRDNDWLTIRSRVLILSFTSYNFDYDIMVSSDFLIEMPPAGLMTTRHIIRPVKPRLDETRTELAQTYADYFCVLIGGYIFFFVSYAEMKHKTRYHKAGYHYYISLNGICDLAIVILIVLNVFFRWHHFKARKTGEELAAASNTTKGNDGFKSFSEQAFWYTEVFCIDGLLMIFVLFRILSFVRLNRKIYLMWHALGKAINHLLFFIGLLAPLLLGFVVFLHHRFGPYMQEYSQLSSTFMELYMIMSGDPSTSSLLRYDRVWALGFVLTFYFVVTFSLLNVFITIVVDAYYVVQITGGGPGKKRTLDDWVAWAFPSLLINLCQTRTKGPAEVV